MCNDANRDSLIAFVYGELPRDEQRAFETHLAACAPCRDELAGLRAVRDDLLAWAPPECRDLPSSWAEAPRVVPTPMERMRAWAPAFGLAAAAMLVLAASAAIANLQIRYGADGLTIMTGRADLALRSQHASAVPASRLTPTAVTAQDLAALEARLRTSFSSIEGPQARAVMQTAALSSDNPQLTRDVRRLIEESERRVSNEMATRLLDLYGEWDAKRRADMLHMQSVVNQGLTRTGADIAQQRDMINRLMLVSQGQLQK